MCFLWAWRIGMTCIVAFRRPGRRGRQSGDSALVCGGESAGVLGARCHARVIVTQSRRGSSRQVRVCRPRRRPRSPLRCWPRVTVAAAVLILPRDWDIFRCFAQTEPARLNACGPTGGPVYLHDDHEELETNHSLLRVRAEKGRGFSQKHTRRDPCCLVLEDHQVSEGQEDVLPEAYKDERIRRDSSSHPRATRNSISKGLFSQVYFH